MRRTFGGLCVGLVAALGCQSEPPPPPAPPDRSQEEAPDRQWRQFEVAITELQGFLMLHDAAHEALESERKTRRLKSDAAARDEDRAAKRFCERLYAGDTLHFTPLAGAFAVKLAEQAKGEESKSAILTTMSEWVVKYLNALSDDDLDSLILASQRTKDTYYPLVLRVRELEEQRLNEAHHKMREAK